MNDCGMRIAECGLRGGGPAVRHRTWASLVLSLLAFVPACLMGAEKPETTNPKSGIRNPEPEAAKPPLSPEEQAARDLLERYKAESKIKQGEERHLAEQHFKTGRAHFDNQAWKAAYDQFKTAVALDPTHKQAREYLRKASGLLGLKEGTGPLAGEYIVGRKVSIEAMRIELLNLYEQAKTAYEKGEFLQAIELFTRVAAKARYLAPYTDTAKVAEEAEEGIGKAKAGIEQGRSRGEEERRRRAVEESDRLRKQGESRLFERQRAQLAQARALFGGRRYEDARKLCDEVLRHDPANGEAAVLRATALGTARAEAVDRAVRSRAAETNRWAQEVAAQTVPQNDIVAISRGRLEEVRGRKGDALFDSGLRPPEAWETRIREALERKVTFDFVETPLADVVSFLGSLTEASMVLDTEALKGGMPNVSLRVQDMRLEAALNWLCKLVGLRYALRDEAIFISRPERIYDTPVLRMYDITDLTIEIKNFKGRQRALSTDSGHGVEDFFREEEKDEEQEKPLSGKELIEFLQRVVAPTGPEDDGGMDRLREVAGLPRDGRPGKGQELVDLIGVTVGGRTFLGVKTRE
ncbi:MAG TPA: hypothetical protein VNE39_28260 [Planctomycetota bacterium]|nr:hypothetical protein [Planctomycetota bacterium]